MEHLEHVSSIVPLEKTPKRSTISNTQKHSNKRRIREELKNPAMNILDASQKETSAKDNKEGDRDLQRKVLEKEFVRVAI